MLLHTTYAQLPGGDALNQGWEFADADDTLWRAAQVPGTIHTDLMSHQLIPDPYFGTNEKGVQWVDKKNWIYRKQFNVTTDLLSNDGVRLYFPELDTYADVYLNGQLILQSKNMFVGHAVEVKKWLKAGVNEIRIFFHSPIRRDMQRFLEDRLIYPAGNDANDIPLSIYARKAPYHYGWDWGPRLVTAGISGGVFIQTWNKARINEVWLQQQSLTDKAAVVNAVIDLHTAVAGKYTVRIESTNQAFPGITLKKELVAGDQQLVLPFNIKNPKRWWPNGLGDPFLYEVKVAVYDGKKEVSKWVAHLGLRTVEVVNAPDSLGESFYVKVNGQPVFMKGANYIPQDNFRSRVNSKQYRQLFNDMQSSHFNMVRVWGGGAYERDEFYELADQHGILVWQDFMFACTLYPSDTAFLENVKAEVSYNIRRLRNHASLALWCGNNEVAVAIKNWGWRDGYGYTAPQWDNLLKGYDTLFKALLPVQVKALDPGRFYFHSSPISNWGKMEDFAKGDNHYWGVWHGMEWFEAYNTHVPRFMSEYGFQSFPDIHTVRRFADVKDHDLYSPVMLSHQKSGGRGNAAISTYLNHYYREPKDFPAFLYVNQVLQAEGMRIAIEAHRRAMPYCMGTLYWQLNDCWPGPSWSGIDYYGRWKALQYYVKKAFAPVMVSNVVDNGKLQTWLITDIAQDGPVTLDMQLMDLEGKVLWKQSVKDIMLKEVQSKLQHEVVVSELLKGVDERKVIFYTKVVKKDKLLTRNVYYFANASIMELPDPGIQTKITADTNNEADRPGEERYVKLSDAGPENAPVLKTTLRVTITANKHARNVYLLLDKLPDTQFSDNYFDVLPGESVTVTVKVPAQTSVQEVQEQLSVRSLRDTFKN
ncbi:glycoside hydrolase family 2 protein [Chitinophaga sp. B61]|uniref:Beta-mannosidase B n=2 Tax=Chitinophaga rhizophila TaxID=2866212 RepID=A0ABS7GCZ9_9BACT|nr:glycoside hydrolase family 2 protein [Chitinophaga rhizophila]